MKINWPNLTFPPINLWSAPIMLHKYDFQTGSLDDEPIIKAIRGKKAEDYMEKLAWFDNNPKPLISISERNQ